MRTVSVAELKAKLSEYLAAAKGGEDVIVTDRGQAVARLGPLSDASLLDARVAELVRLGLARPPKNKLSGDFFSLPRGDDPDGAVLSALLVEREEGW
jgi:prevent-host-death family protein